MNSHFFAYLFRLKLIDRWSLMHCLRKENVQEHSMQVAMVGHALATIKNKYFYGNVDASRVALIALFHDASEVITGDLPTPVKYFSSEMRNAYKELEVQATKKLVDLLPQELREEYKGLLHPSQEDKELNDIIKAADSICAYIKCVEEKSSGNAEFNLAIKTIKEKIDTFKTPEVEYFMKTFIPSFSLSLDEIAVNEVSSIPPS